MTSFEDFFDEVRLEVLRQLDKWGQQEHDDYEWQSILIEEIGEVGKCLNEDLPAEELFKELTQCAAVIANWYVTRINVHNDVESDND